MITWKNQILVDYLKVCLSLSLLLLPIFIHAQEEDLVEATSTSTSTPEIVESTSELPPLPYATETLLGDEVYGDFVVGPGKLEVSVNPGESKTVEITVSNRTGGTRIFEITAEDVRGSDDPTQALVLLGDDRGPYTLKDYVKVEAPRFSLPHNQRARIPVTITIPPDAEAGGRYGSILVSTISQEARPGDGRGTAPQSAVIARIGATFFVTIPGNIERNGILKDFSTVPDKNWYTGGPITFGLLFENTGSAHLAPYGEIRIHNIFNEEVGFIQIDPWFVLPNAVRLREMSWNRDVLFGRYVATAHINRSYDDHVDDAQIVFWVLPWQPLALIFAAVFLVVFMIRAFFKKFEFKRKE